MISSPKSTSKLAKEEEDPVEVPKTNSKRKRGTGNDKGIPSSSEKVHLLHLSFEFITFCFLCITCMSDLVYTYSRFRLRPDTVGKTLINYDNFFVWQVPRNIEYGENLVGSMVKVWWPDDEK